MDTNLIKEYPVVPEDRSDAVDLTLRDLPIIVGKFERTLGIFIPAKESCLEAEYFPAGHLPRTHPNPNPNVDYIKLYGEMRNTMFSLPKGLPSERYAVAVYSESREFSIKDKKTGLVVILS